LVYFSQEDTELAKTKGYRGELDEAQKKALEGVVPDVIKKSFIKNPNWKYGLTAVREIRALETVYAYFWGDKDEIMVSPASAYPERHNVLPEDMLKPRRKE